MLTLLAIAWVTITTAALLWHLSRESEPPEVPISVTPSLPSVEFLRDDFPYDFRARWFEAAEEPSYPAPPLPAPVELGLTFRTRRKVMALSNRSRNATLTSAPAPVLFNGRDYDNSGEPAPDADPELLGKPVICKGSIETPELRDGEDQVEFSLWGPPSVPAGREFAIEVVLSEVLTAEEIAPDGLYRPQREFRTVVTNVPRDSFVALQLRGSHFTIFSPVQIIKWTGRKTTAVFRVVAPPTAGVKAPIALEIQVNDQDHAVIYHSFEVDHAQTNVLSSVFLKMTRYAEKLLGGQLSIAALDGRGQIALRHRRAFISYSDKNMQEVANILVGMEEARIEPTFDNNYFDGGIQWQQNVHNLIDRADLAYIMWSPEAKASYAVAFEVATIGRRRLANPNFTVKPIYVSDDDDMNLPEEFQDLTARTFATHLRYSHLWRTRDKPKHLNLSDTRGRNIGPDLQKPNTTTESNPA